MEIKATASWLFLRGEETDTDWNKNNWKPLDRYFHSAKWGMWDWDSGTPWGASRTSVCDLPAQQVPVLHNSSNVTPEPQQLFMASSNSSFTPGISISF